MNTRCAVNSKCTRKAQNIEVVTQPRLFLSWRKIGTSYLLMMDGFSSLLRPPTTRGQDHSQLRKPLKQEDPQPSKSGICNRHEICI